MMRKRSSTAARIENGVLELDGQRRLLMSGEYPYYRDRRSNWPDRLSTIRASGLWILTCYVPWRHHARQDASGEIRYRFDGSEAGNADLIHFLTLAAERDLLVILKPGPFVKGGLQFGGLPDFVSPAEDGREALLSAAEKRRASQNHVLPAPFHARFVADVRAWLRAFEERVVADRLYPQGPILGLQIGNEGLFSDANLDIAAFDYSPSGRHRFRRFMETERGESLISEVDKPAAAEPPRNWRPPADLAGLRPYIDWGEWCGRYLKSAYDAWLGPLHQRALFLVNLAPPARGESFTHRPGTQIDAWLSRAQPERLGRFNYGFSSWVGNSLVDDEALRSYMLAAKRHRGPNLEENWGFTHHGPWHGSTLSGIYHAVLALGAGATGFNVYNVCATASWSDDLMPPPSYLTNARAREAAKYEPPYCPRAPLSEHGESGRKFEVLRLFAGYLRIEEEGLLACSAPAANAWGFYPPYAYLAAWNPTPNPLPGIGRLPAGALEGLGAFVDLCLRHHVEFDLLNLETVGVEELTARRVLVMSGSIFLAARVQQLLVDFVTAGGTLVLLHERPILDERLEPCSRLYEALFPHTVLGDAEKHQPGELLGEICCRRLALPPGAKPLLTSPAGFHGYELAHGQGRALYVDAGLGGDLGEWLADRLADRGAGPVDGASRRNFVTLERRSTTSPSRYLFLLSRADHPARLRYAVDGELMEIILAPRCCAIVHIDGEGLQSCFFKGVNEMTGEAEPLMLRHGGRSFATAGPCDAAVWRTTEGDRWEIVPWEAGDG